MKVVNDQYPLPVLRVQVIGQGSDHISRHLAIEAHQLAGILTDLRLIEAKPHGLDDRGDEPDRVGVGHVATQPRRRPVRTGSQPVGEQHGLARPRRAHHQAEPNLLSPV